MKGIKKVKILFEIKKTHPCAAFTSSQFSMHCLKWSIVSSLRRHLVRAIYTFRMFVCLNRRKDENFFLFLLFLQIFFSFNKKSYKIYTKVFFRSYTFPHHTHLDFLKIGESNEEKSKKISKCNNRVYRNEYVIFHAWAMTNSRVFSSALVLKKEKK